MSSGERVGTRRETSELCSSTSTRRRNEREWTRPRKVKRRVRGVEAGTRRFVTCSKVMPVKAASADTSSCTSLSVLPSLMSCSALSSCSTPVLRSSCFLVVGDGEEG